VSDRFVHIDLDVDLQGDELTGRVVAEGRPGREFACWVGLIAALDAVIDEPPFEPDER
jgi:hypothetical protein